MARRGGAAVVEADATTDEAQVEETSAADTTPTESTSAPEGDTKAELTAEQLAEAAKPFMDAVAAAVAKRDSSTGNIEQDDLVEVNKAYSTLENLKVKNAGKRLLNEALKSAMGEMDIVLARSYMKVQEALENTPAKRKGEPKAKAPKEPVNPTEEFIERLAVLNLAYNLAFADPVEGLDEDWQERADTLVGAVNDADVATYKEWLTGDSETRGDAPESATPLIQAAVKLSLGRSAKPGKASARVPGGNGYAGPQRSIPNHIREAFADKEAGTFMKITEIRNFVSSEYGTDHPSAGAISARLFPPGGKECNLDFVTPTTNENGDKGAVKL